MFRSVILTLTLLLMLAFVVSCSGGGNDVVTPPPDVREVVLQEASGTVQLGLWQFTANKATGEADMVQLRSADAIINVLGFMEPPPLTLMDLDWPNLNIDATNNIVDVGVILEHPIPGDPVFTGFDCRGVCFGPTVTNADGLTIIPGPENFTGVPFGWMDGALGAPDSFGNYSGLAGYKYFCDSLSATGDIVTFFSSEANLTNRGKFSSGATRQRDYNLFWDDPGTTGFLVFNYAIYANYNWPVGDPPIGLDNFDITTANSAEAFCMDATVVDNTMWYSDPNGGGELDLDVEIWDWQGNCTEVTIESGTNIAPVSVMGPGAAGSTSKSSVFSFVDVPATPGAVGDITILVTATDTATFGESWFMDLLPTGHALFSTQVYNCFETTATVAACPPPAITDSDPDTFVFGETYTGVSITGTNFIAGTNLAAQLIGTTTINFTGMAWVSGTEVTGDITLPITTTVGDYDLQVTNGCSTPSNLYPCTVVDYYTITVDTFSSYPGTPGWTLSSSYWDDTYYQYTIPAPNFITKWFGNSVYDINYVACGSNGMAGLNVTSGMTSLSNQNIPVATAPNNIMCGAWDDLVLRSAYGSRLRFGVLGSSPNRQMNIWWDNYLRYSTYRYFDFYIRIAETTGVVEMMYQDMSLSTYGSTTYRWGASATSGLENATGTRAAKYSYNQAILTNGKRVTYTPNW